MTQTVLELVQDHCETYGLPVPTAIIGSTDPAVRQYKGILRSMALELAEKSWQEQKRRGTFVTVADEVQGTLQDLLLDTGYNRLVQGSIWDETEKRPVYGPVGDPSWEMWKAYVSTGPIYKYWIAGDEFHMDPVPPAGHTIGLIYYTRSMFRAGTGFLHEALESDADSFIIPDVVTSKDFEWRWRKLKGEPWQDEYNAAQDSIAKALVKDTAPILSLDGSMPPGPRPGIWIPAGSWNVS